MLKLKSRESFVDLINKHNYKRGVEVGVKGGLFSKFLLKHTKMILYSVDPWEPNPELTKDYAEKCFKNCKGNLAGYGERSKIVRAWSPTVCAKFDDGSFDFVYIDACHDYESVKKDLMGWWPKLRVGGLFAGHDYHEDNYPGLIKAVDEFAKLKNVIINTTLTLGDDRNSPSWWFYKPGA